MRLTRQILNPISQGLGVYDPMDGSEELLIIGHGPLTHPAAVPKGAVIGADEVMVRIDKALLMEALAKLQADR